MTNPGNSNQAWQALRRSRLRISSRPDGKLPLVPGNLVELMEREARKARSNMTGYRPAAAVEQLVGGREGQSAGMVRADAEAAVRQALLARFPAFANSWDGYIDRTGYLLELLLLPEADQQLLAGHPALGKLRELAERAQGSQFALLESAAMTVELGKLSELNSRRDETHPAYSLMTRVHGLHPELARAVLLHSKAVPWWAYAVLGILTFMGGMTFLLALVAPRSSVFENESVGGVNFMHYTLLPLITIGLGAALWWLVKNRRKIGQDWLDQLDRYRRETDPAADAPASPDIPAAGG